MKNGKEVNIITETQGKIVLFVIGLAALCAICMGSGNYLQAQETGTVLDGGLDFVGGFLASIGSAILVLFLLGAIALAIYLYYMDN